MFKTSKTNAKFQLISPTPIYLIHILRLPVALKNPFTFLKP
jgi:hypothetical protein